MIGRERATQCDLLPRDSLSDEGGTAPPRRLSPPGRREERSEMRFQADEKQRRRLDFLISQFGVADCVLRELRGS